MNALERLVTSIESVDGLDRLTAPVVAEIKHLTDSTPVKNALSGTWLGHPLHPPLTDVPIGTWAAAGLLDLLGGRGSAKAARRLVALGILAAVPTAAAGLSDWSDTHGGTQRVGAVHAAGNVAALTLQMQSYRARRKGHRIRGAALSGVALGLVAGSGYLGGHMSFNLGVGVNRNAFEPAVTDWSDAGPEPTDGAPVRVVVGDVPVLLVRDGSELAALSATCCHAGGPLDEGELVDGCIQCPWHGSTFRLRDGEVVRGPATSAQPRWETRVVAGRVEVRQAAP